MKLADRHFLFRFLKSIMILELDFLFKYCTNKVVNKKHWFYSKKLVKSSSNPFYKFEVENIFHYAFIRLKNVEYIIILYLAILER